MKRANRLMLVFGAILAAVSFVVVLAFGSFGQPRNRGAFEHSRLGRRTPQPGD